MQGIFLNWLYSIYQIIIPLFFSIILQYLICKSSLKYGWIIPTLSVLFFVYKVFKILYPSMAMNLYKLNPNIIVLHIGILIIYSTFFLTTFLYLSYEQERREKSWKELLKLLQLFNRIINKLYICICYWNICFKVWNKDKNF